MNLRNPKLESNKEEKQIEYKYNYFVYFKYQLNGRLHEQNAVIGTDHKIKYSIHITQLQNKIQKLLENDMISNNTLLGRTLSNINITICNFILIDEKDLTDKE